MIGTTGINSIDYEAIDPNVRGIICNEIATHISDSPNFQELDYFLKEKKFLLYMGLILVHLPIRLVTKVKLKLLLWILMMSMHLIRLEP